MSLSNLALDAFYQLSKSGSFTAAAKALNIGQPALSSRIQQLEKDLNISLLHRVGKSFQLTREGQLFLNYCIQRRVLEKNVISKIKGEASDLAGKMRISGPSSIISIIVVPAIKDLCLKHPRFEAELMVRQNWELPEMLIKGRSDFVFYDKAIKGSYLRSHLVGFESFAIFEGPEKAKYENLFYDTFDGDHLTERFFEFHKKNGESIPENIKRHFSGDVQNMIELVKLGIGRAVLPIHQARQYKGLRRVDSFKSSYEEPVYLNYRWHELQSDLQKATLDELKKTSNFLKL